MNLQAVLAAFGALLLAVNGQAIPYEKVKPFPQPKPVTLSEKAAVKFKPTLNIKSGCVPYPAVDADGKTSEGAKPVDGDTGCTDPPLGSQVYGRSAWHGDAWAIMYTWFFPKGFEAETPYRRHDWASVIVWIDNPALKNASILGISIASEAYKSEMVQKMRPDFEFAIKNGTTIGFDRRLDPTSGPPGMDITSDVGESQDLVMWDQLTEEARDAFNTIMFGGTNVPFNDDNFKRFLRNLSPF